MTYSVEIRADKKGAKQDAPPPEPEVNIPVTMDLKQIFAMLLQDCSESLRTTLMSLLMMRLKEWVCDYMLGIAGPPADFIAKLGEQLGIQIRLLKGLPASMFAGALSNDRPRSWEVAGAHRFTKAERKHLPGDYDGGKALFVLLGAPQDGTALLLWGNDAICEKRPFEAIKALFSVFDQYSRNWTRCEQIVQEHDRTVKLLDEGLKELRSSLRGAEEGLDDQHREHAELLKSLETAIASHADATPLIQQAQLDLAQLQTELSTYLKGRRNKAVLSIKHRANILNDLLRFTQAKQADANKALRGLLPKGVRGVIVVGVAAPKS